MILAENFALGLLVIFGHALLWVGGVNRLHSLGWPRKVIKSLSKVGLACCVFIPLVAAYLLATHPDGFWAGVTTYGAALPSGLRYYGAGCAVLAAVYLPPWLWFRLRRREPACLALSRAEIVDFKPGLSTSKVHSLKTRLAAGMPGNQSWRVLFNEKSLCLRPLPPQLDGLSIAHISDIHLTGHLPAEWFHAVVERVNEFDADLVAITGDLFDSADCIAWTAGIFGELRSRLGVYFVLGNHDVLTRDLPRVRKELTAAGLIDMGGRWKQLALRGATITLAGDERPWFKPGPDPAANPATTHRHDELRLLLAHTPDRFAYARQSGFDLMLAGHTHGGQIRFPWVGPIIAPSRHGVRYASGVFQQGSTVMHVSQGLSSKLPLRLNCPPEATKLVLRRG